MTTTEITNGIKNGDHSVIRWLYSEYYIGLCTYAFRFLKQKEEAEEIVQQTFYKLWEKKDTIQINESVAAYLFKSVKNNCLNHIKHQQIVNRFNQDTLQNIQESEELLTISQETGLSIYIAKEFEDKVFKTIENLPGQCRDIFKMSRFEGLKHSEIAEQKGITLNTVQKQISIALEKIKFALDTYISIFILLIVKALE